MCACVAGSVPLGARHQAESVCSGGDDLSPSRSQACATPREGLKEPLLHPAWRALGQNPNGEGPRPSPSRWTPSTPGSLGSGFHGRATSYMAGLSSAAPTQILRNPASRREGLHSCPKPTLGLKTPLQVANVGLILCQH